MVLAQGLGHADRQASRNEEGDRGPGPSAGRHHAPHMGRWHRVPVDPGASRNSSMKARSGSKPIGGNSRSTQQWKDVPRGTMDEVSSHVRLNLSFKLTTRPRERLFYFVLESHDGRCYGASGEGMAPSALFNGYRW